jgi:hypothetical protein|tara:strand:- start:1326 stop:1652 length:327 start_codon:yes stop_codon:yes gene_type:complete
LYTRTRHKELPDVLGVPGDLGTTRVKVSKVKLYTQSAKGTIEEIPFIRNIHDTCRRLSVGRMVLTKASQNCLENHIDIAGSTRPLGEWFEQQRTKVFISLVLDNKKAG